jgi:hypothetical protein
MVARSWPIAAAVVVAWAAAAVPASAAAPLDVRVGAEVRPGTELSGWFKASADEGGSWDGADITVAETWERGAGRPVRIRGAATGNRERVHYVDVVYRKRRSGAGTLTEATADDPATRLELQCAAQGAAGPGAVVVTDAVTTMQIVDQPGRNRVVVRGPGIPFLGPECRPPGLELPMRRVGILPPSESRPWTPMGARTPWEIKIPRARFAAGGTFRFRGRFLLEAPIQRYSGSDVYGTGIMEGNVAVDLTVRALGSPDRGVQRRLACCPARRPGDRRTRKCRGRDRAGTRTRCRRGGRTVKSHAAKAPSTRAGRRGGR